MSKLSGIAMLSSAFDINFGGVFNMVVDEMKRERMAMNVRRRWGKELWKANRSPWTSSSRSAMDLIGGMQ